LPGGVRNSEGGSYTGVCFSSHPYRGAVKGGSEIVEGGSGSFGARENFTALDRDAILSGP
jgi:hypothetical protein